MDKFYLTSLLTLLANVALIEWLEVTLLEGE